ncbi:MAG: hypothetical protein GQ477_04435 [Nanohaloarchaea archaeon]|nr:hypothetical protein [Candidatus Nanohaloarchaea archaeon]
MKRFSYVLAAEELGLKDEIVDGVTITADYVLRGIVTDYNAKLEAQGIELTKENKMSLNKLYTTLKDDTQFLKDKELYETSDTQRVADPVADAAIENIFGPNTPMGDIPKPKAYTPREIEYVRPETLNGKEKEESDLIRKDQADIGKLAVGAMDSFVGTGIHSLNLGFMGINTDAIAKEHKRVVPMQMIDYLLDTVTDSYDLKTINTAVRQFTEFNNENDLILSEKYQTEIDAVLDSKYTEIARYTELATKQD